MAKKPLIMARLLRVVVVAIRKYFGGFRSFVLFLVMLMAALYGMNYYMSVHNSDDEIIDELMLANLTQSESCGQTSCPFGKYSYLLKSGFLNDLPPTICFRGQYIQSPSTGIEGKRGLTVVVINEKTVQIEALAVFDLYDTPGDDKRLQEFLQSKAQDNRIILAASFDDITKHLSKQSRQLFHTYGSAIINKVNFRENFVIVGQKGLTRGSAIEKYDVRNANKVFAEAVEIVGCMTVPIGRLSNGNEVVVDDEAEPAHEDNCGMKRKCNDKSFPVALFTGLKDTTLASLCISGNRVLFNATGRGLNVAVVVPDTKQMIRAQRFDTFDTESEAKHLVDFLIAVKDSEILVVVSCDESTRNLGTDARSTLETFGSTYIKKLAFRDAWVFIGQRALKGRSPYEELEFAYGDWPEPITMKVCVPSTLTEQNIANKFASALHKDKNTLRAQFCEKHPGYGDFCSEENRFDPLRPSLLIDPSMQNLPIFEVPIVVVPGKSRNAARLQFEALLTNPGILPTSVTVFYEEIFKEYSHLADLFGFKSALTTGQSKQYSGLLQSALERVWALYPRATEVLVLEEEVVPTANFFNFHSQLLEIVRNDSTLLGVSAWNENGYDVVSNNASLTYRVQLFPGLGFMLKKSVYEKEMKSKMQQCCVNRTWDGWLINSVADREMIVPDVSRVYRLPYESLAAVAPSPVAVQLFNRRRLPETRHGAVTLSNVAELTHDAYEEQLNRLLHTATPLPVADVRSCLSGSLSKLSLPDLTKGLVYTVFYDQDSAQDQSILTILCKCFQLYHVRGQPPRGLHNGLVRFSFHDSQVFLVGASTQYFKHKPSDYLPITNIDLNSGP